MKTTISSAGACLVILVASTVSAQAGLIQLDESQFNAATGGAAVIEDFEGFATGSYADPFVFANGRYNSSFVGTPVRIVDQSNFGPTQRLTGGGTNDVRSFDLFPSGTTLVGMDVFYIDPTNTFDVIVVGGSGTLNLSGQSGVSLGTFLAFQDELGITSIQITKVTGASNYSFDNFQTAASAPVPEPSSLALLGLGAVGLNGVCHRRRFAAGVASAMTV